MAASLATIMTQSSVAVFGGRSVSRRQRLKGERGGVDVGGNEGEKITGHYNMSLR